MSIEYINPPQHHADLVRQHLSDGRTPILPFERKVIKNELALLADQQKELGGELHEVMNQSSETWHDNAPADIVSSQSRILHQRATALQDIARKSIDIPYPDSDNDRVTLGSIVDVQYDDSPKPETLLITGYTRSLKDTQSIPSALLDDCNFDIATLSSPVGENLLGTSPGDTVEYEVEGRVLKLTVLRTATFPYLTQ